MSEGATPRVSVLMTLYNKGRYVEEAVRSVLESTFTDLELLVVDDASTDDGPQRVRNIPDPRIRLLTAEKNTGRPAAANRGYDAARGEFVAVLDADDRMFPERLARQVALMDARPEIGACGTTANVHGAKDETWYWPETDAECRGKMLFSDPLWYGSALFRKRLLNDHHLRCDERWLRPGMDFLFLVAMAPYVRFANIQEPLTHYRIGEQNMRHGRDPVLDRAHIYREQFRLFGLAATDEEIRLQLMLHRLFVRTPDSADVRALHTWIRRLKRMNRSAGVFPIEVFEAELDRRWHRLFHPIADVAAAAALVHFKFDPTDAIGRMRYLAAATIKRLGTTEANHRHSVFALHDVPLRAVRTSVTPAGWSEALPPITLVTPSYQQAEYVEECLNSVKEQSYPSLEHIVVDGGSTDGSRAIIEAHAEDLKWWCSERDGGQSDAIAKGGERGTGAVFGWLNSDDILLPGALWKVGEAFARDPKALVICGARILRKPEGDSELSAEDADHPETYYSGPRINQQSTFFRMDVMREMGFVERKLNYVMDYELWLQLMFRYGPACVRSIPDVLSVFRQHATSKTSTVHHRFLDEMASVLHGLCASTGLTELMAVLEQGHSITPGLRRIPLAKSLAERDRVRTMVVAFLLKWHYTIWRSSDLRMMRSFRGLLPLNEAELTAGERERLHILDDQLRMPDWNTFRLRRKWRHLRR